MSDDTKPPDTASNVLVVWFSATGTTERIAMEIADALGADTCAIVPETPYRSVSRYAENCAGRGLSSFIDRDPLRWARG